LTTWLFQIFSKIVFGSEFTTIVSLFRNPLNDNRPAKTKFKQGDVIYCTKIEQLTEDQITIREKKRNSGKSLPNICFFGKKIFIAFVICREEFFSNLVKPNV